LKTRILFVTGLLEHLQKIKEQIDSFGMNFALFTSVTKNNRKFGGIQNEQKS